MLSVRSTGLATENKDALDGSAKKAQSLGGVISWCLGSGGMCAAILGLKCGWMRVG